MVFHTLVLRMSILYHIILLVITLSSCATMAAPRQTRYEPPVSRTSSFDILPPYAPKPAIDSAA